MSSIEPSHKSLEITDLLGLLCISAATLLLQVSWTRVLSVTLWYHFAFLVISTAMLGFGISGVLLTVSRRLADLPLRRALPFFAGGQALTTLLGFWIANRLPFAPFSLLSDRWQLLYGPIYLLCIALPFVFGGLTPALLLSRLSAHSGRLYCFDLVGAGLGCALIIVVMPLGGVSAIAVSATLAACGCVFFARGRLRKWSLAAAIVLGIASPAADHMLPLRISHTKTIGGQPAERVLRTSANLHTAWNTFSRIDVLQGRHMRYITIDAGTAMTRMPRVSRPPRTMGPVVDERRLLLPPDTRQSVLIIGSGGGWEVLAALRSGASKIVAVEVNPLINALVRDKMARYVGRIFANPAVELHTAEARSFIRRDSRRYDLIMASHTISNAATASGAMSLTENYLLTTEAFVDYIAHLNPRGVLWFTRPEVQLPRLVATIRQALKSSGAKHPQQQVIAYAGKEAPSFTGGVIVTTMPMSPDYVKEAKQRFSKASLRILYTPGGDSDRNIYQQILAAASEDAVQRVYREHTTALRPTTDDRPFFNQRNRWTSISLRDAGRVFRQQYRARLALEDQPVAEVVLLVVLLQSSALAALLVLLPLWRRHRWRLRGRARPLVSAGTDSKPARDTTPQQEGDASEARSERGCQPGGGREAAARVPPAALQARGSPGVAFERHEDAPQRATPYHAADRYFCRAVLVYFLILGLGFILVEIALIQRLTLFIGQPVHTFAVVVGALLVFSGCGSLASQHLAPDDASILPRLRLLLALIVGALLLVNFATPPLLRSTLGLGLPLRITMATAVLAPLGLLLGTAFPLGLRHVGSRLPQLIPWAWGLNAVASVVGSVGAIILATLLGFSGVLLIATVLYLCAGLLWTLAPPSADLPPST